MLKSIKLIRAMREGWLSFYRDKWLTIATITIMTLTLFLVGLTFFLWIGVSQIIDAVEKRINVSVYFDYDVAEERILDIQKRLDREKPREIKEVRYVSREEALVQFKEQEQGNDDIQQALAIFEEKNENPLPAALVIVAQDIADYTAIHDFFTKEYGEFIISTNYAKNKDTITDIRNRIIFVRNTTFFLSLLFVAIAILVTFNTVRMSIYAHRKEFEVMRLVGASNLYVKTPVITEGVLYGLFSSLLAIALLVFTIYVADPFAQRTLSDARIFSFYRESIVLMAIITITASVILGAISSHIAIRRYLEK